MRTPPDARGGTGGKGGTGRIGRVARIGGTRRADWMRTTLLVLLALPLAGHATLRAHPAPPAYPAYPAPPAQVSFEAAANDLASADAATRLRAVQLLKTAAYPEAALPLAALLTDPQDDIQLEAIAAELNIFLARPIAGRKRLGLIVEVRTTAQAEPAFSAGPDALGAQPVPPEVLNALRAAARDENARVAAEALYAFGVLGVGPHGAVRRALLRAAGPDVAAFIGSSDAKMRYVGVRVLGRVFARRAQDEPIESTVGDPVITALNDSDAAVRSAAMQALGAMRYARGVQALSDLFTYYRKGEAAETALIALAHIADPSSAPLFAAQLSAKSPTLRLVAIEGLARTGDRSQMAAIERVLDKEREASVSLAGAFAAVMLGNGPTDHVADSLARPRMREQAKRYLVEMAPGRTGAFSHQLLDADPDVRIDTIDALGLAEDPAAVAVLAPLVHDANPLVAQAAERAIARLKR
jgi:HEAT repeat protein